MHIHTYMSCHCVLKCVKIKAKIDIFLTVTKWIFSTLCDRDNGINNSLNYQTSIYGKWVCKYIVEVVKTSKKSCIQPCWSLSILWYFLLGLNINSHKFRKINSGVSNDKAFQFRLFSMITFICKEVCIIPNFTLLETFFWWNFNPKPHIWKISLIYTLGIRSGRVLQNNRLADLAKSTQLVIVILSQTLPGANIVVK